MSKIINKILNTPNLSLSDQTRLMKEWLQTDYQTKNVKDTKVLEALSSVHNHDNLPLHFGEVHVGSTFSAGYIRVVEVGEGWHLAHSREPGKNFTIIHPTYEKAGQTAENVKLLTLVKSLLAKGTLVNVPGTVTVTSPETTNQLVVKGLEEKPVTSENDLTNDTVNIADFGAPKNGSSITINMNDYLK